MKKQQLTKALGALCLCFAVAGGVSVATASATSEGVVSIENGVLKIDGTEVTAASANFQTWEKASVRYDSATDSLGNEYTGMRFLSWLNDGVYEALMASSDYTVSFGTLIASENTVTTATAFTKEGLPQNTASATYYKDVACTNIVAAENEKSGQTSVTEFSAIIYGTSSEAKFAEQRMARAYMTVTSVEDATKSVTLYADYNAEESRSIADVAMGALQANEYKTAAEDAEEKEFKALTKYAKASSQWKTGYDYMRYIKTWDELKAYAANEGTYIVMKNDISAMDVAWVNRGEGNPPYAAIREVNAAIDGNGKKLTVVMAHCKKGTYWKMSNAAVFGIIGESGVVRNLIFDGNVGRPELEDAGETTHGRAAGFANRNDGLIENCYLKAVVLSGMATASTGNAIGMLQLNTGTIQNVVTDLRVWDLSGYYDYGETEDSRKYGIAVANNGGTIKNSVSINATSFWKISSDIDMLNGKQDNGDGTYTYSFGPYLDYSQYVEAGSITCLPSGFINYKSPADAGRSDCYTFASIDSLLSGTGKGDAFADNNTTTYDEVEAATAQEKLALGGAWSFDVDNAIIKLGDTIVYERINYKQGVISWETAGEAVVSVNGNEVATVTDKKYDMASYLKANIATLAAGDVEIAVAVGGRVISDTMTLVKVGTLADLKTAAANEKAYIYLTQDIDLSGASWGYSANNTVYVIKNFNATLEGNAHKMYGLTKTSATNYIVTNIGFIETVGENAAIRNVRFEGTIGDTTSTVIARRHVGLFAWRNDGLIENCYIKGTIDGDNSSGDNGSCYGTIYLNTGTIKNVITDLTVWCSYFSVASGRGESANKYAFAVANNGGEITGCVSVATKQANWLSTEIDAIYGTNGKDGVAGTEDDLTYSFGALYTAAQYPTVIAAANRGVDQNRTNCYAFTTYLKLIADDTAKTALGSAWTFDADNGKVKLYGVEVN